MSTNGKLPPGWAKTTLGEVRVDLSKGIIPNKTADELFELYSVPSHTSREPELLLGQEIGSNKQTVVSGVVLLCKINPRINRVWVVGKPSGHRQIASTEWIAFWPLAGLIPAYLSYYLQQNQVRDFLAARSSGVGGSLMRVRAHTLAAYPLFLAPTVEQRRIVQKIEELFSKLDAGVAALERVKSALKRYRAAVLKAAVEGKLTAQWRAHNPAKETAAQLLRRILDERRRKWEQEQRSKYAKAGKQPPKDWQAKYKEPAEPDLTDIPRTLPSWVVASLEQLSSTITSGSRDWSRYYDRGSGIFILAQNVRPGKLDLAFRQVVGPPENDRDRTRSQVADGDILVTIVGANTGDVCRVIGNFREHYVCQSVALVRLLDVRLSPFIESYLVSSENGQRQFKRYIYGQGRPHLGFDQLRGTPILLPPVDEQQQIVTEVDRRLSVVDEIETQIEASLKRASRLRQSILKRAFEGRLVPQDPHDEPAEKLLARIRAERLNGQGKSSPHASASVRGRGRNVYRMKEES